VYKERERGRERKGGIEKEQKRRKKKKKGNEREKRDKKQKKMKKKIHISLYIYTTKLLIFSYL